MEIWVPVHIENTQILLDLARLQLRYCYKSVIQDSINSLYPSSIPHCLATFHIVDHEIVSIEEREVPPKNECPICREEGVLHKTPCNHHFHQSCLHEWLRRNNTCPLCRTVI
jgi:hypothetical protein